MAIYVSDGPYFVLDGLVFFLILFLLLGLAHGMVRKRGEARSEGHRYEMRQKKVYGDYSLRDKALHLYRGQW
ncbi:unnamed protein product, partial [Mesorhabditis spiculigera]